MTEKDINKSFYESIKNSQPIAFLSSLSMVIAVFAHNNVPSIYTSAIFATIMFVVSFCISLWDQMYLKEDPRNEIFYYGKIFFFGFGILYLIKIAIDFSKDVPNISYILTGWIFIAFSLGLYRPVLQKIGKFSQENYSPRNYQIIRIVGLIVPSLFVVIALPFLLPLLVGIQFETNMLNIFLIICSGLIAAFLVLSVVFIKKWSQPKKLN